MALDESTVYEIKNTYLQEAERVYEETEDAYQANRQAMRVVYEEFNEATNRSIREKLSEYKNDQHFKTECLGERPEPPADYDPESGESLNEIPADQWSPEDDKPYFENEDGNYVYHLKSYPGDFFVMEPETRKQIYEWYSNWDGSDDSVNTICRRVGMRRTWFIEWKKKEGLTHDSEPFTPEEILEEEAESLTDDLLMMRKKKLWKDWKEKEEKEVLKAAEKYWNIEKEILEPVAKFLEDVEDLSMTVPDYDVTFGTERKEDYALLIGVGDTHIGRTVHGEYGHTVQDTVTQAMDMIERTLERASYWGQPEEIYLLFLGDIFQYDTTNRETGSGNRRDALGIPPEVLDAGFSMANNLVSMMDEMAPTTVRVVPGNHDPILSRALLWQLHNKWNGTVDIELSWDRQQYVAYEENLIGLAHACSVKPSKLTDIMPRDAAKLWGQTSNRYYIYGHPHRPTIEQPDDSSIELLGIGSPASGNEYEHKQGYVDEPRFGAFQLAPKEGRVGMPAAGVVLE